MSKKAIILSAYIIVSSIASYELYHASFNGSDVYAKHKISTENVIPPSFAPAIAKLKNR